MCCELVVATQQEVELQVPLLETCELVSEQASVFLRSRAWIEVTQCVSSEN